MTRGDSFLPILQEAQEGQQAEANGHHAEGGPRSTAPAPTPVRMTKLLVTEDSDDEEEEDGEEEEVPIVWRGGAGADAKGSIAGGEVVSQRTSKDDFEDELD